MGKLINDKEVKLFDSITQEHLNLCGEKVVYWILEVNENTYDNIYGEPIPKKYTYRGGYDILVVIKYNPPEINANINGSIYKLDGEIYITRADFDRFGFVPKQGDIIQIFSGSKYFPSDVLNDGKGIYFAVIQVGDYGHIHNTNKYTWYKLTIARKTDVLPDVFIRDIGDVK